MSDLSFSAYEHLIGSENVDSTTDPPVLFPTSEHVLADIVRRAAEDNMKIAVRGKGTYPVSQPTENVLIVSTTSLSSVKEVNPEDFIVIAQAGAVVDTVIEDADRYGFFIPLDIISGNEATIGGAFMTGVVGPSAAGYGAFRDAVIGVRCVTAAGEIITGGGRTAKNVTGYDITRFLSGTMGLFAIVSDLTIKVLPVPESRSVVVASFHHGEKFFRALKKIVSKIRNVTMVELMAPDGIGGEITLGVGIDGMEAITRRSRDTVKETLIGAGALNICEEKRENFMELRRKAGRNMVSSGFFTVSVPPSSSDVLLEKMCMVSDTMPVLAHPAIGRFHAVCSDEAKINTISEISLALGGKQPVQWSRLKKEGIAHLFTKSELEITRTLKRELDPSNIFNPHFHLT